MRISIARMGLVQIANVTSFVKYNYSICVFNSKLRLTPVRCSLELKEAHHYNSNVGIISRRLNSEVFAYRVQRHLNKWKKVRNQKVSEFWLSYLDLGRGHTISCKTQHFTIIVKDFTMILLLLVFWQHPAVGCCCTGQWKCSLRGCS